MQSNQKKVLEFTSASANCEKSPTPLNRDEVEFLAGMVLSEVAEFLQTVIPTNDDVLATMHKLCDKDLSPHPGIPETPTRLIANQADAMVDWMYYTYNASAKKGIDLDEIFKVVHDANMAKRHPDGEFKRRDDGKIIKPDGWQEPDINAEIERQISESEIPRHKFHRLRGEKARFWKSDDNLDEAKTGDLIFNVGNPQLAVILVAEGVATTIKLKPIDASIPSKVTQFIEDPHGFYYEDSPRTIKSVELVPSLHMSCITNNVINSNIIGFF